MRYGTGMVLVLAAGLLWSFQALIIRQIGEAGPWTVLFWRSLSMFPVLLAMLVWRSGGSPLPAIRKAGLAGVLGGIGLVAAMGGAILAFQTTTIANAAFLLAASPFLTAILGRIILGEPVAQQTWMAIGIALVGIFIMVREGLSGGDWLGNAAALASALGFAAFTVTLRWRRLDDILWCVLMGVVTMSCGMILYTLGSKVVPSAELTLLSNVEVMLAPFWVWLLMNETASAGTFLGGGILLVAILFNAYSGVRRMALA